jgi:hypothetical protein
VPIDLFISDQTSKSWQHPIIYFRKRWDYIGLKKHDETSYYACTISTGLNNVNLATKALIKTGQQNKGAFTRVSFGSKRVTLLIIVAVRQLPRPCLSLAELKSAICMSAP